ncbi:MAG: hypothetical protein ACKOKF_07730 [Bacteroidota bacterium]
MQYGTQYPQLSTIVKITEHHYDPMSFLRKIILLIPLFWACSRSNVDNNIPNVQVDLYIPLSLPEYATLNGIGNHVLVAGGYKGILIFRKSIDHFAAYERACPYDPMLNSSLIVADSNLVLGIDRTCGSRFNFFDGSVINGPSSRPLKQYNCDFDAQLNTLRIYN